MKITFKEAETLAIQHIAELQEKTGIELLVTKMQEDFSGWIFFYQSKEYIETKNISSMLAGNAPFIVDCKAGAIHTLGTAHPVEFYIREYAQRHKII